MLKSKRRIISLLLCLSLFVSALLIFVQANMTTTFTRLEEYTKETKYNEEMNFNLTIKQREPVIMVNELPDYISEKRMDIWDEFDIDKGNVFTKIGLMGETLVAFEGILLIDTNEEIPYKLESGRYPSAGEIAANEKKVVIGKGAKAYTYENNHKTYIALNDEEYEVVGLLLSDTEEVIDYRIVVYWSCLSDSIRDYYYRRASSSGIIKEFTYGTEGEIDNGQIQKINDWIFDEIVPYYQGDGITYRMNEFQLETSIAKKENVKISDLHFGSGMIYTITNTISRYINMGLIVLGIGNCYITCLVWILYRKKEIAIRKAFGMKTYRVLENILREFLIYFVSAFAAAYAFLCIWTSILERKMKIFLIDKSAISQIALTLVIVVVICFVIPVIRIGRRSVIQDLQKG